MAEASTVETIRAACETIVPSVDGAPGATEVDAHELVIANLEKWLAGAPDLVASVLDAYAAQQREGARFVDLDDFGRGKVFRALADSGVSDLRDAIDGLVVFTLSAVFSEWNTAGPWNVVGYHGPVDGVTNYRVDA